MKRTIALAALSLSACEGPSVIETVNADINHNHTYKHYAKADFRILKEGEPGNCAAIAFTKKAYLESQGIKSSVMTCRLTSGEGHAFLLTDEGVLDNRFDSLVSIKDVGCVW